MQDIPSLPKKVNDIWKEKPKKILEDLTKQYRMIIVHV